MSAIRQIHKDSKFASIVYDESWINNVQPGEELAKLLHIPAQDVLTFNVNVSLNQQPYFAVLDRAQKRIVVAIRGSTNFSDWVTNSKSTTQVISRGVGAHSGFYESSKNMLGNISDVLAASLLKNPGFDLMFTGHSLGAAIASISTYVVRNNLTDGGDKIKRAAAATSGKVTALCFSTPPVMTLNAAIDASSYTTTVIVMDDVVPRAGVVNANYLIESVANYSKSSGGASAGPIVDRNFSYAAASIKETIPVGSETIYPMYAPGRLLQLVKAGWLPWWDNKCSGGIVTAKDASERFKRIKMSPNMVADHKLVGLISCLRSQL